MCHDIIAEISWKSGEEVVVHGNSRSIYRCPYCARPARAWLLKQHVPQCLVMKSEGRDRRLGEDLRRAELRLMTAQQVGGADDVMQAQRDIRRISDEIQRIEQEMRDGT